MALLGDSPGGVQDGGQQVETDRLLTELAQGSAPPQCRAEFGCEVERLGQRQVWWAEVCERWRGRGLRGVGEQIVAFGVEVVGELGAAGAVVEPSGLRPPGPGGVHGGVALYFRGAAAQQQVLADQFVEQRLGRRSAEQV